MAERCQWNQAPAEAYRSNISNTVIHPPSLSPYFLIPAAKYNKLLAPKSKYQALLWGTPDYERP